MEGLPCGSRNYLVLFNLQRRDCNPQANRLDQLPSVRGLASRLSDPLLFLTGKLIGWRRGHKGEGLCVSISYQDHGHFLARRAFKCLLEGGQAVDGHAASSRAGELRSEERRGGKE